VCRYYREVCRRHGPVLENEDDLNGPENAGVCLGSGFEDDESHQKHDSVCREGYHGTHESGHEVGAFGREGGRESRPILRPFVSS